MLNIKKILQTIGFGLSLIFLSAAPALAVGANGSFENGTYVDGGGFETLAATDTSITGWTVDSGSIDWIDTYWTASNLQRSIDLNGLTSGSVSQSLTTVVGGTYNVTFDLSGNPDSLLDSLYTSPSNKIVRVSATGAATQDYNFDTATELNDKTNMKWKSEAYSFVATNTTTTLSFASQIAGAFGPAIDNVVITETLPKAVATGGLTLSGPRQQISFNAFDYGDSSLDKGHVEYQNFDYPGGLHYTADVLCANVKPATHQAWFMFQIPAGFSGLSGLYVVSYVQDLGSPGTKDKYGHAANGDLATATAMCENGTVGANYTTTGGNAVVHK